MNLKTHPIYAEVFTRVIASIGKSLHNSIEDREWLLIERAICQGATTDVNAKIYQSLRSINQL